MSDDNLEDDDDLDDEFDHLSKRSSVEGEGKWNGWWCLGEAVESG